MLHLRVIAPVDLRDEVVGVLRRRAGVTHLVVHRDAALEPAGDEISADIARESANDVVDDLKALGLRNRGAITLDVVDTVVSTAAYRAEKEADGDPGDAIVWEELAARTREESTLNVTFLLFLCLACMIAAVGVVTDSPVTVVGAMVVGPEFGPLAALAFALLAGAAGMLSLVSAKSAALVGVFISVTTVPAAGFAVVAASVGDWDIAAESTAQLLLNLVGITVAGVLVLAVRRRHASRPRLVRAR
ncbi:DUF389 domain-containing protein [Mycobacterium sp. DL592]|uniref:DUF389 domain-containing protein n=1 Tax=Mycobacterium sp. DL592 TaxID=2675524 RepID=UPI00141EF692|nr:DUF389 domain-containing protein [Mycobacterium sp. DL592]